MKGLTQHNVMSMVLLATILLSRPHEVPAQQVIRRLPATQIAVDEDILAAFVDEPCRNFEAAQDALARGDRRQAAEHLRVAAAFLRLEAARAVGNSRDALDVSIGELYRLAAAVENNQILSIESLQQAFTRAHYALASHHCIKSSHRCCQPAALTDQRHMQQIGYDLKAATTHVRRGASWSGGNPDRRTVDVLNAAQFSADQLIQAHKTTPGEITQAIRSVRDKLEGLTGRKIMLAPPLTEDDKLGPSIMR